MLATFRLNKSFYEENKEEIKRRLDSVGIEGLILNEISNKLNWFSEVDIEVLKKICTIANDYNDILDLELQGKEDLEYMYDDVLKKLFLHALSNKWVSAISITSAINVLQIIEKKEEKFKKSVIQFEESEIKESMHDLFGRSYYFRLRQGINIFSKLQTFYKEYIHMTANWEKYKDRKTIEEIIGQDVKKDIVTKKDLFDLISVMPNVQESIIPLLIFEGVSFSKIEEMDELRYLKASDVRGNKIFIGGANERILDIDDEVVDALSKAINSEYLFKTVQHEFKYVELEYSEYILRPTILSRKRNDTSYDKDIMSFRGVYSRFLLCKDLIESTMYDVPFSPKILENFGKVYYVNKYLGEGIDVYDAIRKTLVRFGNWEGDIEKNKSNVKNVQMVNRLKKIWDLYTS
ncbi:hypothetical protein [Trichococcus shcherbakoviae]|uniref:Uncharacterized protein n=1 Tax=Trichococcus shcherbakoviae subsp. psychrophilus TaxID=2585775 RepID=A0A5C5E8N4_9LACT|nr:hypothetical protein [Trichococcus shcherbakoviae]TNV68916.1 hypothetical protein FHK04_05175 [Trichococcus shcherbakoviae subsp. psychrophilus]